MYLNDSISHDVIKEMTAPQLRALCKELRSAILHTVNENGGHLASNLGTVELTVALHAVFDVRGDDKLLWDVGHQTYAHKLLTGRFSSFDTLRKKDGISGFARPSESKLDAFISGHSSTSVSAAFGFAMAKRLKGEAGSVAAVIGDGALTGGLAYEGLNNAGKSSAPLTVVLNDNAMSISKSTGALARYLAHVRSTRKYYTAKERVKSAISSVPLVGKPLERAVKNAKDIVKDALYDSSNLFENLGFSYIGPVNGHNIEDLIEALSVAKLMHRPCVVHVFTTKGKGWKPAEENPGEYHAVLPAGRAKPPAAPTCSEVFGRELERLAKSDSRICAITAAMKYATGLNYFSHSFPSRFFDTGIAEPHSITFAAGLSCAGMTPVFAVYSTFLQRGFDQLLHDCAIDRTHIVLAIDRAGFVGEDGETHQGIFDVPMLRAIPNTTIYSPAAPSEIKRCLRKAIYDDKGIACVRYPKGVLSEDGISPATDYSLEKNGGEVLAVSYGRISRSVSKAARTAGADFLRLVQISPIPRRVMERMLGYKRVVFFEEGSVRGGVGEGIMAALAAMGGVVGEVVGAENRFVPAATVEQQLEMFGLDEKSILARLQKPSK